MPGSARAANDSCFFKGAMFSDGADVLPDGRPVPLQGRRLEGDRLAVHPGERVERRARASLDGISYATGAASCQNGTQYRCEDGAWNTLNTTCPVADSPVRSVPDTRTCMYEGATVASNSTICKGGTTFLCSAGEWTNLGTLCR